MGKSFKIFKDSISTTPFMEFTQGEFIEFVKSESTKKNIEYQWSNSIEAAIMTYMALAKGTGYELEIAPKFFESDLKDIKIGMGLPDHETWQSPKVYTFIEKTEDSIFYISNTHLNKHLDTEGYLELNRKWDKIYEDNKEFEKFYHRSDEERAERAAYKNEWMLKIKSLGGADKTSITERLSTNIDFKKEMNEANIPNGNFIRTWYRAKNVYQETIDTIENQLDNSLNADVISKDNIHLHYGLMSDIMKKDHKNIIDEIISKRFEHIAEVFDVNIDKLTTGSVGLNGYWAQTNEFDKNFTLISHEDKYIGLEVFGIKDTMQPLEEYISEIQKSEQYLSYIMEKQATENKLNPIAPEFEETQPNLK